MYRYDTHSRLIYFTTPIYLLKYLQHENVISMQYFASLSNDRRTKRDEINVILLTSDVFF